MRSRWMVASLVGMGWVAGALAGDNPVSRPMAVQMDGEREYIGAFEQTDRERECGRKTLATHMRWILLPKTNLGLSWKKAETEVLFRGDGQFSVSVSSDSLAERLKASGSHEADIVLRLEGPMEKYNTQELNIAYRPSICLVNGKKVN